MSNTPRSNKIYIALVEVKPLARCQLDPEEYSGAAVRLYIPAADFFIAVELLKCSLNENHFELTEILMLADDESVDWENPDDELAIELKEEALDSNEVVYGEFNGWE